MNRRQKLVQKQFLNNEKAVVDRLAYIYDQSLAEIEDKIRNLEFTIGDLTEQYEWADDKDKEVIKSKIQSKIYQKQYQEQLQAQVDGILKEMQTKQFLTVSDYLDTCYEDGFVGSLFDMHGQGVPLAVPLDQEAMVRAIQLDSKISQGLYTRLGEDVNVLKKRITSEVTRSIATGTDWKRMAKRLENQTQIGYNRSVRIARTEGHRIQCTAADDAAHDAKARGADIVKQWDATLDGATRESHVTVDGEIRELDEKFSNGLMFPGDPAGGAAEVINCRCAYLQRARWALGGSFTKMNNFTGEIETFESPEAYNEFKKGFFSPENKKYMNYVQQMEDKYKTKDFRKVLDKMDDREYKHYSKLLNSNPLYNKNVKTKAPAKAFFHDVSATTTKLKTAMGETEYNAFMQLVQTKEDIAPLYDHLDEIPEVRFDRDTAEYWYEQKHLWYNYPHQSYMDGGMHKYRTVSHEYGHFVDRFPKFGHIDSSSNAITWNEIDTIRSKIPGRYTSGWKMHEKFFSNSDQFLSAMRKDLDRIQAEGTIKEYCMKRPYTTVAIQDALDGYGLGRLWWGHGDKYYNREYNNLVWYEKNAYKGNQLGFTKALKEIYTDMGFDASNQAKTKKIARQYDTASELWASILGAETTGGGELESIKEQFPETYKAFKELVKVAK